MFTTALVTAHSPIQRQRAAESVLFQRACGKVTKSRAAALCHDLGFQIDLDQPVRGHRMDALDTTTGRAVELSV